MANPAETLFVEIAVSRGFLDRAQADEALKLQRASGDEGRARLIRDILVERGWMTAEQVRQVEAQIEEGSTRTGRIAGYKLLAKIGQGGMGAVYKAEREETGEIVALKILPSRLAEKGDFAERFLREARAASKIVSDHIVRTVDVGFSGGYYYFAMEFVEGESVDTTLSIDGPMAESKALRIVHQIALALRDAEKAGMVHRDIKPGNILVTPGGVAKLTDFGLARETEDQSMTQAGMTLGTPNYMSPEQAKAVRALDVRSDIYSLGVTFYHMVTGTVPFHGETSMLTMIKHLNEPPVAPIHRRPDLSQGCNDVILKMLVKNRDLRYRNADQLITDLERVLAGKPPKYAESTAPKPEPRPAGAPEHLPDEVEQFAEEMRRQARRRWVRLGAGLAAAALAGLALYALFFAGRSGTKPTGPRPKAPLAPPRLEREAKRALEQAKTFARSHPDQLVEIAERYAAVEAKYQATAVYDEARRLAEAARAALAAAAKRAYAACEAAAEEEAARDRFGAAIAAFDQFPATLRSADVIRRIERAKKALKRRAWDKFRGLSDQARELMRMNQLGAAREIVERARDHFGISGIVTEAGRLLEQIEAAAVAADSARNQAAIAAYQAAMRPVRSLARKGRFSAALAELRKQQARAEHDLVRAPLAAHVPTLLAAQAVWDQVMKGIAALQPGFKMPVARTPATFVKYDPRRKRLHFKVRGRRLIKVSPGWLPPAALKQLALAGSGGKISALRFAAFFLARGDYAEAAAHIRLAQAAGASPVLVRRYRQQLDMLQKSRKEIEAENLLAKAREQAALAGAHEQAERTLRELISHYADTNCCARNRKEIEAMIAKTVAKTITADTLFAVTPTDAGGGRAELTYDFADLAQDADWPSVWKQRPYGHWPIQHVYGEKTCRSGLVYFKVPLRGDFAVEVRVKDVQRASLRFGMPTPAASPRAAGFRFNWRRTRGGAETTLERAGKPLVGTRRFPRFRVVGALVLSIEVKNGVILARAGGKLAHRAVVRPPEDLARPGYFVLAGFNPGARLTRVTLRFRLDRAWLEKHFVQPLRRERLEQACWLMARYRELLPGSDAKEWRRYSPEGPRHGEWTFRRGTARAPENTDCVMTTGDPNWSDYAFTATVRVGTAPGGARLLVRWTDAAVAGRVGKGYGVQLIAGQGTLGTGGRVILSKAVGDRLVTLREASIDLAGFRWYRFAVEVRGRRIRVLRDGSEVLSVEDETYAAGRVGLASLGCGARFKDIRIKLGQKTAPPADTPRTPNDSRPRKP